MKKIWYRIVTPLAIGGLVLSLASPALASVEYDPNDPYFDPSGTYVPPVVEEQNVDNPAETSTVAQPETNTPDSTAEESLNQANETTNAQTTQEQLPSSDNNESGDQALDASNDTTGAGSNNDATIDINNEVNTDIDNQADIDNDVDAQAGTGNNEANFNTGNGSVETGDANLVANLIAMANSVLAGSNSFAIPLINIFQDLVGDLVFNTDGNQALTITDDTGLSQIASNFLTGANSDNSSIINQNNNTDTNINNQGDINNDIWLGADSGHNQAIGNTGDGTVQTGDANIAANVVNFLNTTILSSDWWMGMINIFGDWTGNLLLPSLGTNSSGSSPSGDWSAINDTTGANSLNDAIINSNNETDVNITNDATIYNNILVNGNTGENQANGNTGNGEVATGDVDLWANVVNVANTTVFGDKWWMVLVNTLDGWAGVLIGAPDGSVTYQPFNSAAATNEQTGSGSDNQAIIDSSNETSLEINNDGRVTNNLVLDANTGYNEANYNTGSGQIATGDANIMANMVNFVNSVFNVDKWMLGVVNVFGRWDGTIQFGMGGTDADRSASAAAGSIITAANDTTGAGSDNNASVDINNRTNITIDNKADINKEVDLWLNTGNNEADYNTGSAKITTGNIRAKLREIDIVNQVIIAKKEKKAEEEEEVVVPDIPRIIEEFETPPFGMGGAAEMPPILPVAGSSGMMALILTLTIAGALNYLRVKKGYYKA